MRGKGFLIVFLAVGVIYAFAVGNTVPKMIEIKERVLKLVKKFQVEYELKNIYTLLIGEYSEGRMISNQMEFREFMCKNFQAPSGRRCYEDPFGVEYRFIKYPGGRIEVRSAGPDRTFWTKDDVFIVIRK